MKILVLGTGGAIGDAATHALAHHDHDVISVSRRDRAPTHERITHIAADRSQPDAIAAIVAEYGVDAVIDMLAYTVPDTRRLQAALDGRISRYVLVSSSDVYRNYGRLIRRETGAPDPSPLTEDAPLRTEAFPYRLPAARADNDPLRWMDNYDKIPIEMSTEGMASEWTILRLPMVYGPRDPFNRFQWALAPMLAGAADITLPNTWGDWVTTYAYVGNVGVVIAASAIDAGAAGQTLNVVDEPAASNRIWFDRLKVATGWQGTVSYTDDPSNPMAQATKNLDLTVPLAISGAKLHETMGFTPPISVDVALAKTVEAAKAKLAAKN